MSVKSGVYDGGSDNVSDGAVFDGGNDDDADWHCFLSYFGSQ